MTSARAVVGGDDVRAVVLDCGSYMTRTGCAGDDVPRSVIPSAVGVRRASDAAMSDAVAAGIVAGDQLWAAPAGVADVRAVYEFDDMNCAKVADWDALEHVWRHACGMLRLPVKDALWFVVEPAAGWEDSDRAKAMERLFEGLQLAAAYLARGSATAAFASGRTTACVVDVGQQGAVAVPVLDGYVLRKSVRRTKVGGKWLSEEMFRWVEAALGGEGTLRANHEVKKERLQAADKERRFKITDLAGTGWLKEVSDMHRAFYRTRVVEDMKMHLCTVSQGKSVSKDDANAKHNPPVHGKKPTQDERPANGPATAPRAQQQQTAAETGAKQFTLPDGNVIVMREDENAAFADTMFKNVGIDTLALPELVFRAVSACDVDIRRDLFSGVVVTGGSTLIPGTVERFTRELAVKTPQMYKLKVLANANSMERTCAPWIGGSIVASLGTFQKAWVSKAEYEELGAHAALRKCP